MISNIQNVQCSGYTNAIAYIKQTNPGMIGKYRYVLSTGAERVALLKQGLAEKYIESLYIKLNGFTIINVDWQDPE